MRPRCLGPFPTVALSAFLFFSLVACNQGHSEKPPADSLTRFTWQSPKPVFLAGEFNQWSPTASPMHRDSGDRWTIDVPLPPGRYQYKFVVDGEWFQDTLNPASEDDGWGGLNSVITVGPDGVALAKPTPANDETSAPPWPRTEVRWKSIDYPDIPIPGAPGRTMTGLLRVDGSNPPGTSESLDFRLIFGQATGEPTPSALAEPEKFSVRMHLPEGKVVESRPEPRKGWDGAGNSFGLTMGRLYEFPWSRNAYDEAWIECRLDAQTFWFEVPYGFSRNPRDPWPKVDASRSGPVLAAGMKSLTARDQIISWRAVEYEIGEIQNHWRLTARMANPFRPAAEIVLYHDPDDKTQPVTAEAPRVNVEFKGLGGGARVAFRKQGRLLRIDTFSLPFGGSDDGRDAGTAVIKVDDRSYEFTIPSSLYKYVHGRADYENPHRLKATGLFEQLLRSAD